ncbi:helix-turn-helix domain-containing protein [Paenibacillus sp. MCAF20]
MDGADERGQYTRYVADVIARVSERRAPRNKRVVEEVMSQIDSRYGDAALNLQALADHSGVSSPYLSKIFREVMKKPITQYISEYRLEKARERLMGEDSAKINLIAEQCGFNDYPYFSKIFKKYFGVSPLEYKEKNS